MDLATVWDELVRVAHRLQVDVREEVLYPVQEGRDHGRGGLCIVRGQRVVLVDARATLRERVATLAGALAALDLDPIHLAPLVRQTIERGGRVVVPRPPSANEPGTRVPPPPGTVWVRVGVEPAANDAADGRSR